MSIWSDPLLVAAPSGHVSGNPVEFEAKYQSLNPGVIFDFPITQLGSGTPSPTNIRPIVIFNNPQYIQLTSNINQYDTSTNYIEQGAISSSTGQNSSSSTRCRTHDYISIKPSTHYVINTNVYRIYAFFYDSEKTFIPQANTDWQTVPFSFTSPSTAYYCRIVLAKSNGNIIPSEITNLIVQDGYDRRLVWNDFSDSSINYSVVQGQHMVSQSISQESTLTTMYDYRQFNGTETWNSVSSGNSRFYRHSITNFKTTASKRGCSHFSNATVTTNTTTQGYYAYNSGTSTTLYIQFRPNVSDSSITPYIPNVTAWKQYLTDQYNAGTPVTCYFYRNTPVTYNVSSSYFGTYQYNYVSMDYGTFDITFDKNRLYYLS